MARLPKLTDARVLQEQVLAHRGLIFESRQLRWRCLCGSASEAFPSGTSSKTFHSVRDIGIRQYEGCIDYPEGRDGFDHLRMWNQEENPMPNRTRLQRDNQYDAWYSMVTDYNTRALSYETDALTALAGLSSAFGNYARVHLLCRTVERGPADRALLVHYWFKLYEC
jgi:hypothetical protein